jgi:hypothetical protein
LVRITTNGARCKREIKSRIATAKAAFNKKKTLFTSTFDLNLRNKLIKCYIWSTALYGAETWTLRKVDQNIWKVLKCVAGQAWRDRLARSCENEISITQSQKGKKYLTNNRKREG